LTITVNEQVRLESTYTLARPDCPQPSRWHAVDEYAAETEVADLVAAMVAALRPDHVVETGTHVGHTAVRIGRALADAGVGRLTTLEIMPHFAAAARERCVGLPVDVVEQSSLEWTPEFPVDFAWFDSEPHLRGEEFRRLLPWMHARTVVGFHDTAPHHPTRNFIDPLVAEGLLDPPLYLPTPRGLCLSRPRDSALTAVD
jgi:Methyltransferase domain